MRGGPLTCPDKPRLLSAVLIKQLATETGLWEIVQPHVFSHMTFVF